MISRAIEDDFVDKVKSVLNAANLQMPVRAYPVTTSEMRNYTPEHERGEILVRRGSREFSTSGVDLRQKMQCEVAIFMREIRDLDGGRVKHGGLYDVFDVLVNELTGYTPTICKGKFVPVSDEVLGYVGEFWIGEIVFEIEGYYPHKRTTQ